MGHKLVTHAAAVLICATFMMACVPASVTPMAYPSLPETEVVTSDDLADRIQGSIVIAQSIGELSTRSTIVVVGSVSGTAEIVNMARNVEDPMKPADELFILGRVYRVDVQSVLKGETSRELMVVQSEGYYINGDKPIEEPISEALIEQSGKEGLHQPFDSGQRYLLFLEPLKGFAEGYFTGVAEPWRFNVTQEDKVVPESSWDDASRYFAVWSLKDIAQQVANPDKAILVVSTPHADGYPAP